MPLLLPIFFLIYGSMHAYLYYKLESVWRLSLEVRGSLLIFMVIMVLMPLLVHLQNKRGSGFSARFMAYFGYTWMGFLLLFVTIFLTADAYNLLIRLTGIIFHLDLSKCYLAGRSAFLLLTLLVIATAVYSLFNAQRIRTERITLATSKLPAGVEKLTIAQISDLHLGLIVRHSLLEKTIAALVKAKPDLVVSTGDLVDAEINHVNGLTELFHQIKPKYGKFAVIGNHDFYAGLDEAILFTQRAGFRLLRGEGITVGGIFNIAGIDDQAPHFLDGGFSPREEDVLAPLPRKLYTIFLKHRPEVNEAAPQLFDLQLSGHTHAGQIFPFRLVVRLFFSRLSGLYELPGQSYLYVSQGTGTWGPPMRFLASPQITVIEIVAKIPS